VADLDGKVAFVTGGGQGIGAGVSLALARAGASVGLFGRTRSKLEDTAAQIADLGGRAHVVTGDVGVRADVEAAVAEVTRGLGPIWVLFNNATTAGNALVEEITDELMEEAIRSNIFGSLYTMQACFPIMKERGGRIVNVGSGGSTMGVPSRSSYNISKEGVRGLTKTAAVGWGKYGITVNTLCPLAGSPRYDIFWDGLSDEEKEAHLSQILMRRMGDPEKDIGALVVFLAGPGGGYITSRTIHVDGGRCFYDR
jgi:NAD(P)-dependent dehydrogenase (short-subunit alcohol dehydrogenase family)